MTHEYTGPSDTSETPYLPDHGQLHNLHDSPSSIGDESVQELVSHGDHLAVAGIAEAADRQETYDAFDDSYPAGRQPLRDWASDHPGRVLGATATTIVLVVGAGLTYDHVTGKDIPPPLTVTIPSGASVFKDPADTAACGTTDLPETMVPTVGAVNGRYGVAFSTVRNALSPDEQVACMSDTVPPGFDSITWVAATPTE